MFSLKTLRNVFKGPDDETEFLPAALEIVETPPAPAARMIGAVLIAFFMLALVWSVVGSVDIIATAQGKIVPTGRTKVIQPFETGVVRAIHAQDGKTVKAGDVLIEIDSTINEAERDRLQKECVEAELTAARLRAAVSLAIDPVKEFAPPQEATEQQVQTQKNLLVNQAQEIRAKLGGFDQQIAQQQGNLASVQATIAKLKDGMPFLEQRAEARDYLAQKGYGSRLDSLEVQQDLAEHRQELRVQQGRLAEATAAVASLRQQRRQAEAEWKRANLDLLTQSEQKASSLRQQLVQAAQKFRLQTLTAPVDGTVQQLSIHTEGGVVTPAQALMEIVPADSKLEIEAMVSNRDIGFVRAGQEAAIKVDTFDYTKYGLLRDNPADGRDGAGRANGDRRDSSEPKGQELVYSARVQLDQTTMDIDDRLVSLSPGMAVTVEIKTGNRRIISYLLSPIRKHMHQALRER